MTREVVVTMYCPVCKVQKGTVFSQHRGGGVNENITEPASMTGAKTCPDCTAPLEVKRPESP